MNEQENKKISDQTKEGEADDTKTVKASTENFTGEQQAQPKEKFSTWSGEEPKKVLLAAKPGETLEEFTSRTNQYHEEQARKAEKETIQPFCIVGFEDGSEIVAGGKRTNWDMALFKRLWKQFCLIEEVLSMTSRPLPQHYQGTRFQRIWCTRTGEASQLK